MFMSREQSRVPTHPVLKSHGIKERNFPGLESHGKVMKFHQ